MNLKSLSRVLILTLFLPAVILVLLGTPARAAVLYCDNCTDCNTQITSASAGDTVRLTQGVNNYAGTCINFNGKDGITFDCGGNMIDGTDASSSYGIYLSNAAGGSNNNIITDCNLKDFADGIYVYSSSNNVLTGVTATSNIAGILLSTNANNNTVTGSFLNSNSNYGVDIYASSLNRLNTVSAGENTNLDIIVESVTLDSYCNNNLTNVIGSGGRPILYYNSSVTLQNQVLSELILCNADNSQLRNITITGSASINNNGLFIYRTEYAAIDLITSSFNRYGIYLQTVNTSVLTNITANSNAVYGLYLDSSSRNTVWNLTAMENIQYDAYMVPTADFHCWNNLSSMVGSGSRPIIYYNYSATLQNQVLSELILCNADYSNITDVTIAGSASLSNNALVLIRTDYTNLTRITSSSNYFGIYLSSSSNNILRTITTNSNAQYGIYLTSSSYNTIRNVIANSNSYDGLWLGGTGGSNNNIIDNITANSHPSYTGVTLNPGSNNVLTNITANSNGQRGVQVIGGSNNVLTNITATLNGQYGIYLSSTSYNRVSNSRPTENTQFDVYVDGSADSQCANNLTNIIGSGNRPVMYYNYSVTLQNQVLSELILCNADYSNITNMTIIGSVARKNNAVLMVRTDYTNLTTINSSYRYYGIYLSAGSRNILTNITARYNAIDGIHLQSSLNNTIIDMNAAFNAQMGIDVNTGTNYTVIDRVNASYNTQSGIAIQISSFYTTLTNTTASYNAQSGVFISSSPGTVLRNVTANSNTQYGVYLSSSSNSSLINVTANSNIIHGVYLLSSSFNTLSNVTANSNTQYGIYLYSSSNNTVSNSLAENNRYDINVNTTSDSNCDNYLQNVVSSGGRQIMYYNDTVTLYDQVFSELILCNADNSQLRNITIAGSDSMKNNGIVLLRTDYATLTQINSSYRYYGFYISSSTNNLLDNITSTYNSNSSFYIINSDSNTLTNIRASYNSQRGIQIVGSSQGNTINSSRIEGNNGAGIYGIYLEATGASYPSYNTIYNNIFNSTNNFYSNNNNNSNYWNVTIAYGPNIMRGPYMGGNFWTRPAGGYSDTCVDSDRNAFCDSPLNLSNMVICSGAGCANNTDYLPLTFDTGVPDISFVLPTPPPDSTVFANYLQVNASISEPADTCLLNWYNGVWENRTMVVAPGSLSCYLNMTDLVNFQYRFTVYANDTSGNMNVAPETRRVTVRYLLSGLVLAKFSVSSLHTGLGENRIIKVYVQNPDPVFANITVWIGGDYPMTLARFSNLSGQTTQHGIFFTDDMRNFTVQLNPKNQIVLSFLVMSTSPNDAGYMVTLNANTTGSNKNDSDTLRTFVDFPANFPGIDLMSMCSLVACAGVIFWLRKKE